MASVVMRRPEWTGVVEEPSINVMWCNPCQYSQLSPCGHFAIMDSYKIPIRNFLWTFDWNSLPLLRTLSTEDTNTRSRVSAIMGVDCSSFSPRIRGEVEQSPLRPSCPSEAGLSVWDQWSEEWDQESRVALNTGMGSGSQAMESGSAVAFSGIMGSSPSSDGPRSLALGSERRRPRTVWKSGYMGSSGCVIFVGTGIRFWGTKMGSVITKCTSLLV